MHVFAKKTTTEKARLGFLPEKIINPGVVIPNLVQNAPSVLKRNPYESYLI